MHRLPGTRWGLPAVAALLLLVPAPGHADLVSNERFRLFADFRARFEADRDSRNAAGTPRDDRNRLRVRVRVGARYDPSDRVTFGVRLRTGSDSSQQSPHITILDLDDNPTGDAHVNLDQWYLEGRKNRFRGWVGRNSLPLWKQNELLWDDDVTPAGVGGEFKTGVGDKGSLVVNAGRVSLPAGMRDFFGEMTLAQVVYSTGVWTVALGALDMHGRPLSADPAVALLETGNGSRDYEIWTASVQGKLRAAGRNLTLGADFMRNAEDYPDTDPMDPGSPEQFSFDHRDETGGHVFSVLYGSGSDKGDWLVGYYHARIETLAVNNSFAQDDWVRWGSLSGQTRGSNLKGHELRFVHHFGKRTHVVARLYLVESVAGIEDGNRFRVDLNHER